MMTDNVIMNCLMIFVARVTDVSLGTLRMLAVVQGNRFLTWVLGFLEIAIWLWIVVQVFSSVSETPVYALFYAAGYATGGYVGMTIEKWLGFGERSVLMFTRSGDLISEALRLKGYILTEWQGRGRDGPIDLLFMKIPRRRAKEVLGTAREIDPDCYCVVETAESSAPPTPLMVPRLGWRTTVQKEK
ncbi:MAG: DUF5698 domain-containing protein [Myxococcota bacterium]|nr:DUF5698 domain-containing protein [Myxococcota bacterium]